MSSYTDNSHCRFWVKANVSGTIQSSFNVTSVTDDGPGLLTVTIATDFTNATWCCGVAIENLDATIDAAVDGQIAMIANATQAAGTVQLVCKNETGTAAADPTMWHVWGFGNQ